MHVEIISILLTMAVAIALIALATLFAWACDAVTGAPTLHKKADATKAEIECLKSSIRRVETELFCLQQNFSEKEKGPRVRFTTAAETAKLIDARNDYLYDADGFINRP